MKRVTSTIFSQFLTLGQFFLTAEGQGDGADGAVGFRKFIDSSMTLLIPIKRFTSAFCQMFMVLDPSNGTC